MTDTPAERKRFIPLDEIVPFLRWAREQPGADTPEEKETDALIGEIADALDSDPENPLAHAVVKVMGVADMDQHDVAALYGRWKLETS